MHNCTILKTGLTGFPGFTKMHEQQSLFVLGFYFILFYTISMQTQNTTKTTYKINHTKLQNIQLNKKLLVLFILFSYNMHMALIVCHPLNYSTLVCY